MSRITINVFGLDGACREHAEVSNAMAGAFLIWRSLSDKYGLAFNLSHVDRGLEIWKACEKGLLSELDSICVRFTFDRVWVKREHAPRLVEALRAFHRGHVEGTDITPAIAEVADEIERAASNPEILGFSFNQTSVSSNQWFEGEDAVPYNVLTGTRHWEIFDDYKASAPAGAASKPADQP